MEQFFNSLPKPVLALLAIFAAAIFFWFADPPHTLCDAEMEANKEALAGLLYPIKEAKKPTIQPKLIAAKERCLLGVSSGACFEYFDVLRKVVFEVSNSSSECIPEMFDISEVKLALQDGIEVMARMAWGAIPPEPGLMRLGWFQDAELNLFCRMRNTYVKAAGEEVYDQLRLKISEKLPGEAPASLSAAVGEQEVSVKKATEVFSEQEIWDRSLFSIRCDQYGL